MKTEADTWTPIRKLFEKGYSLQAIREAIPDAPHPSNISRRASKEQWQRKVSKAPGTRLRNASGVRTVAPTPSPWHATKPVAGVDQRAAIKLQVIESLKKGSTFKLAAALAGISDKTLHNYRNEDAEFSLECQKARAFFATSKIESIDFAAAEDWRAASWLLQHHPDTREDFRDSEKSKGGGIQVILQIPRSETELRTLEGEIVRPIIAQKNAPD